MALTQEQIAIVKSTAPILKEHGTTITTVFYRNLLAAHPALKNYFSLRNQQTGLQQSALATSVLAYATYIDDLGKLTHAVERIAQKHASLFVKPEHYPIVGEFLVGAFAEVLGPGLTPEVKDAWIAAYGQLADVFIGREKQLYTDAGEWQSWQKFKIVKKEPESATVTSFYLEPANGKPLPSFRPGQYISLQIPIPELDGLLQSRQFSLSEAPENSSSHYRVSVKREPKLADATVEEVGSGKATGIISNMLHDNYSVGDEVELSPPRGAFFLDPAADPASTKAVVLLSAGVGAAPLLSILDSILLSSAHSRQVTWIHAARNSSSVCYGKHVKEAAMHHDNVTSKIVLQEVQSTDMKGDMYDYEGRLDLDLLDKEGLLSLGDSVAEYYLCGPEEWMMFVRAWLEGKGVDRERQHLELFRTGDI